MAHLKNCHEFHSWIVFLSEQFVVSSLPAAVIHAETIRHRPCNVCSARMQLCVQAGKVAIVHSKEALKQIREEYLLEQSGASRLD